LRLQFPNFTATPKPKYLFMKTLLAITFAVASLAVSAQELPYREIPVAPANYTAGGVAARLVDGLGFRFYWATDGLRAEDLAFKPGPNTRTSEETIAHIYGMSFMILNATKKTTNVSGQDAKLSFAEMRKKTLENLMEASTRLRQSTDKDLIEFEAKFSRGNDTVKYPFWNMVNGPIADCLWHVGQVVSFRRSSGNPFSEKVSVFNGTVSK
jgi:hypothetical protein